MTVVAWCLFGAVLLGLVHVGADSFSFKAQVGNEYTVGPRDEPVTREGMAGRLHRAARNYTESLVLFVAAVLWVQSAEATHALADWGAGLWLGGRIAYLPGYASGVRWLRTVFWQVAMVGLVLMLVAPLL